jgi:hypothetical protein
VEGIFLKPGKLCDCGHIEKAESVKIINNTIICHKCWKINQEREGLVDEGCIFPGAEVCMDREPSIISSLNNSANIMRKAKCYRGHKNCIKQDAEKVLSLIKEDAKNQMTCNFPGCGRKLKKITTINSTTLICPVHGPIVKATPGWGKR